MPALEAEKKIAAEQAVTYIKDGMLVGLGTGSTAAFAIRELGRRIREGLKVTCVASSKASEILARQSGIGLADFSRMSHLDITIDGADEIDHNLRAVKGGGGALFREKILAAASDIMIAIADSTKLVDRLGKAKLPVEVLPFAAGFAEKALADLGAVTVLRRQPDGSQFVTDQDNYIFDLTFQNPYDPAAVANYLQGLPGVVEHGLFLTEIDLMLIATGDHVEVHKRR